MNKYATTFILVALAALLALWLWHDRDHVTSGERKLRENNVFPVWRKEELSELTLAHEGETIVLARDGETWLMKSPRTERADPAAVDRLLTTLEFATVQRRAGEGTALGLDAPRASGSVRMHGLVVRFQLGGPSPRPAGSSYLRVNDEPPIVVGKELEQMLLTPSDVYRDRAVVPYLATELQRFAVRYPGGAATLERIDDRSFKVTESGVLASRVAIEHMWAALAEMRAEAFPNDADVERLTAQPVVSLTMTPKDGKGPPAELIIGDACPGHPADVVVLRTAPSRLAACAPKDIVASLQVSGPSLLDRHAFSLRMDEIAEVRLERIGAADAGETGDAGAGAPVAIELARKGTGFHERLPDDRDLDAFEADAANEVLTRIGTTEADAVARSSGAPFTAIARARVNVGDHDETVEIGASDGRGHAALHRLLDGAWLDAGPALVRLLLPRATTLRPHTIVDTDTGARHATRVVLRCGVEQELVDRGDGFRFVTPQGLPSDGAVSQLVDAILRGRVDPWVADQDDGTFGFTPASCHVVLAFDDAKAPLTVWFGSAGEGGVYGRVDTRSGVFVAPLALRALAGSIFVSRGALRAEASRIESVRASVDGHAVVLDASLLRDAVAALYAERVVALGRKDAGRPGEGDLTIDVGLAEAGAPRRIVCRGAAEATERWCTASDVDATFAVAVVRLAAFLPDVDAGAAFLARDAGAR